MTPSAHTPAALACGEYVDSRHPAAMAFAHQTAGAASDDIDRAQRLYYRVRDDFKYDPYVDYLDPHCYRASSCFDHGRGFCIPKAALMAASARALGIPARVGYSDVRNHLATPRLLEHLGTTSSSSTATPSCGWTGTGCAPRPA